MLLNIINCKYSVEVFLFLLTISLVKTTGAVSGCPCESRCAVEDFPIYAAINGICYRVGYSEKSWQQSEAECVLDGGKLADVMTETTLSTLSSQISEIIRDTWVGAKSRVVDNNIEWVWNDPQQSTVNASLWQTAPSPTETGCGFVTRPSDSLGMFPYNCESRMSFLCSKKRVIILPETFILTVGEAIGTEPVFINITGNGLHSGLAFALDCTTQIAVAQLAEGGQSDGTSLQLAISPSMLEVGTTYQICWASSSGRAYTSAGVSVQVSEPPVLSATNISVAVHTLGSPVELIGVHLTKHLWVALFSNSQCLGTPESSPTELVPTSSTTATYRTSNISLIGIKLSLCMATSSSTPSLSEFRTTEVTLTAVPLPNINKKTYYLTYAETFTESEITLTGQFFSQPNWTVRMYYHSECLGSPVGSSSSMRCDSDVECLFRIPSGIPAGKVLYLCLNGNMKTEVAILATSRPVPSSTANTTTLSHAESLMGSELVIQVRNLETQERLESDYQVSATIALTSEGCSSANGLRVNFIVINPIKASIVVPTDIMPGDYKICIVVGADLDLVETSSTVTITPPPEFTPQSDTVVSWNYYLLDEGNSETQIQITASNLDGGDLWGSFSTGGCTPDHSQSVPFNITRQLSQSNTVEFPGKWLYFFNEQTPSTVITEINFCWAASVVSPATQQQWNDSEITFQVLPPPVIDRETESLTLTTAEAEAGDVKISITGRYLQQGIAWGIFVRGSNENIFSEGTGTSILTAPITCTGSLGSGWCTTAEMTLPSIPTVTGQSQTYQIGWITSLTAPLTLPSNAISMGRSLIFLQSPSVSKFIPIPSDQTVTYSVSLKEVVVPVSRWQIGFNLKIEGINIGTGVSLLFSSGGSCSSNSLNDFIDSSGLKNSSETTLTVPSQMGSLSHGRSHPICVGMTPYKEIGSTNFSSTGLVISISGIPVFDLVTLTPQLEEIWDVSLVKKYILEGSNLDQPGIYTAICKADCSGCVNNPTELVGRTLEIPRANSPTSDISFPATLCWGLGGSSTSISLSASNVMIRYPSVPVIADELVQVPLLAESLSIMLGGSSTIPSGTWGSLCSVIDNQPGNDLIWNKVSQTTSSFSFTRLSDHSSPNSHRLCLTYSTVQPGTTQTGIPVVFSTPLRYKWQGVPTITTLTPQSVFLNDYFLNPDWSGPLTLQFTGSELLEIQLTLIPEGTNCNGDAIQYETPTAVDGEPNSKQLIVNVTSAHWRADSTAYKLCYAAGLLGDVDVGIDRVNATELVSDMVTFQSRPTFSKNSSSSVDVEPIVISRVTQLTNPSAVIMLHGSGFSNKNIFIHVHDGAGSSSACNPNSLIDVVIPDSQQSTDTLLSLSLLSSTILRGSELSGVLSLCWSLYNSNVNSDTPLYNTGTVIVVPGRPIVVSVVQGSINLKDIISGDAVILITGKDVGDDSGVWWGCDTSMPPTEIVNGSIISIPRWIGNPNPTQQLSTACLSTINHSATSSSDRNLSSLIAMPSQIWSPVITGIPVVSPINSSVLVGEKITVEGSNLAPSDISPGVLLFWMPSDQECPISSPVNSIEVFANVVLLDLSGLALGVDMKLCMGLRGGGVMVETDVLVSRMTPVPPTPLPVTAEPTSEPVVTNEPIPETITPTAVPTETPILMTATPTAVPTPSPCETIFEVSRGIRNSCYLSEFGLLFCVQGSIGISSFCGEEYMTCANRIANTYLTRCQPEFESQLTRKRRFRTTIQLPIESFDNNVFIAAVAATALALPMQVNVLGTVAGSTIVDYELSSNTVEDLALHSSQLSQSLSSSGVYFSAISDSWAVVNFEEITGQNVTTPIPPTITPTDIPSPTTTDSPLDSVNGTDVPIVSSDSTDSRTTLIIIIASSVAGLCCIIIGVTWWKLTRNNNSNETDISEPSELGNGIVSLKPVVVPPMMKASSGPIPHRVMNHNSIPSSEVLNVLDDSNLYSEDNMPTVDINSNSPPPRKEWMRHQSLSDASIDDRSLHQVMSEGTRGWMLDSTHGIRNVSASSESPQHFRNPLPSADLCNKCGATWEGGRYCAYCGSSYEVPEEDSPSHGHSKPHMP